jgi:hypothetical protein
MTQFYNHPRKKAKHATPRGYAARRSFYFSIYAFVCYKTPRGCAARRSFYFSIYAFVCYKTPRGFAARRWSVFGSCGRWSSPPTSDSSCLRHLSARFARRPPIPRRMIWWVDVSVLIARSLWRRHVMATLLRRGAIASPMVAAPLGQLRSPSSAHNGGHRF